MTRVDDFFAHSGIKGQKWGRRRWQNPDGTLTPEGRERYGVGDYKPNGKLTRAAKKADRKMTSSLYRHFNMLESDRRLRENAEKQKKKLVSKGKNPAESKKLERRINKLNKNNESKQAQIESIRQYMNEHGEDRTVEALRKAAQYSARVQAAGGGYYAEYIDKERLKRNLETANAMLYAAKRKSLAHSGIKGQKWGRRRWQNSNGTLTKEGRERYQKYMRQLGYDKPEIVSHHFNKVSSGLKSFGSTWLAAKSAVDLHNTSKALRAMSKASKDDPNYHVDKKKLSFINVMSALNVANIGAQSINKIALYRRRRFLIKYADAYGGKKVAEVKKLAQEARNASALGTASAIGLTAYNVFSWKKAGKASYYTHNNKRIE